MPNKIHHRHRHCQLNLHELVMPPMIPCFRHSSSSNSDKPGGRGSIQFRKTAGSSCATYNTLVWRYFTFRTTFSKRVVWSVTYLERQDLHELVQRAPPSVAPPSWKRATSETCSIHGIWSTMNIRNIRWTSHQFEFWVSASKMSWSPTLMMVCISRQMIWRIPLYVFVRHCVIFTKTARFLFFFDTEFCSKMPRSLKTSTTMSNYLNLMACAIIMALGVRAKWQLGITNHIYDSRAAGIRILGGRITTTDVATALTYGYDKVGFYSCSWGRESTVRLWMLTNILLGKLFQKASTMDDKEMGLYTFLQAEMVGGMKTSAISMATRLCNSWCSWPHRPSPRKLVLPTSSWQYSSGSGKHTVCYYLPSIGFSLHPWSLCDRLLRIEGNSYTWRNFCYCTQCSWCFCACFGSTVSLMVQIFCARFLNAYIVLSTRFDLAWYPAPLYRNRPND